MKQDISTKALADSVKQVFLDQDKYHLDKYVPEFKINGKYFADCFNTTIVEPLGKQPPIFYHTYSPYDIVSKKAPNQGLVFQDGEVILNVDFTPYIPKRTAVMSSLVIGALGTKELTGRLLLAGTGRVAREALTALKEHFPTLASIDFINTKGVDPSFNEYASKLGLKATPRSLQRHGHYDIIICHTSAQSPILTADSIEKIKQGALIASFVSENFCELAEEYYDTNNVNVIIDWEQTIAHSAELQRAVDKKIADPAKMIYLRDLFNGSKTMDTSKKYTVYRSHGTPMQDLAALKLLLAD
jgi:ornithine cyclodeaminase/alanine dehydrogenase-like protein (mu-crystallin family)